MKKKFYTVGTLLYNRNKKCGVETAAIIGIAAATAVGTASAAAINADAQSEMNWINAEQNEDVLEQQKELFHEGNIFNHNEAIDARNFNAEQAEINRGFQAGMLENIFNKQEQWYQEHESISSKRAEYVKAGLNPALLGGNTTGFSPTFNVPSGAVASAPPASAANPGGVPSQIPMQAIRSGDFLNVLQPALNAASSLMTMKKTESDISLNQVEEDLKRSNIDVNKATAKQIYKDIDYIDNQIDLTQKNIIQIDKQIQKMDAEIGGIDAQTAYTNMKKFYESKQYEQLIKNLEQKYNLDRNVADATVKSLVAQAYKDKATGVAAYAAAERDKAISNIEIPAQKKQLQSYSRFLDASANRELTQNYFDTLYGHNEHDYRIKISKEEYEKMRYENSTLFRILHVGREASGAVGNTMMLYYGARGVVR